MAVPRMSRFEHASLLVWQSGKSSQSRSNSPVLLRNIAKWASPPTEVIRAPGSHLTSSRPPKVGRSTDESVSFASSQEFGT